MVRRPSAKNNIRSLHRLLRKLPDGSEKKASLEKQLVHLEAKKDANKAVLKEKKYAKRYRGIRFIESQKLRRKIKKLQKQSASEQCSEQERAKIDADLTQLGEDLEYTRHFPNGRKYISILLPPSNEQTKVTISEIRSEIKSKLKEDAIVSRADEGVGIDGMPLVDENVMEQNDDFFLMPGEDEDDSDGRASSDGNASDSGGKIADGEMAHEVERFEKVSPNPTMDKSHQRLPRSLPSKATSSKRSQVVPRHQARPHTSTSKSKPKVKNAARDGPVGTDAVKPRPRSEGGRKRRRKKTT
mmetsp:Transcript_9256/g.23773  ORF Transcript_9256/g.23773 Transcript_9256/m.23773 type:complete len:299 (-) Transcript_9256:60-956(-)|eukprot:CAMPEP_0198237428 /NCGR_PEP_ID=MMETSP1446-20131203/3291_1 /TAXON_ID=1461542 ORGANISM="Unidentified sp, Strain CCMP2111" /NCGR_SAMPLE_ID=MMETSP1446 /ASSEMBLY_ACC=CAM_ASM_001112 /LENGTH=298 /DNA_ID=CAMNT_0043919595 /DNA_START=143 /DNA_END=1039 /DNA_ORIENTATION=-